MLIRSEYSTYSVEAHDDLLRQWEAARYEAGPLQLDLSRVGLSIPTAWSGWCCFSTIYRLKRCRFNSRCLAGRAPEYSEAEFSGGPVSYLTRMGFWEEVYQLLDAKSEQIPVRPARLIDRSVLLDITIMRSHDAISVMLRKTARILQNLVSPSLRAATFSKCFPSCAPMCCSMRKPNWRCGCDANLSQPQRRTLPRDEHRRCGDWCAA
jgi:hypothetical protein